MSKLLASIKKEILLLLSDKIGLFMMFALPVVLVVIITLVQSSAFDLVNENRISLLIINEDEGELGAEMTKLLNESKMFSIRIKDKTSSQDLKEELNREDVLCLLYIPAAFSQTLNTKTRSIVSTMLVELGIIDSVSTVSTEVITPLDFVYDPVLQSNFSESIKNAIFSFLNALENEQIIKNLYFEMGYDEVPDNFTQTFFANRIEINSYPASDELSLTPNVTQHNVPAWTIFAMFFMVVSLGGNMVNERVSGSFVRLKTMATPFYVLLGGKMMVFILVALLQVLLIFSIGMTAFPAIGLPKLVLPDQILQLGIVTFMSALAAVSYAILIGTFAKTQVQANGFGAISIIIFAALGGIWVPAFVLPESLIVLSQFSPLKWCLDAYYILFLKGGNWLELQASLLPLLLFIISTLLLSLAKLKMEKIT